MLLVEKTRNVLNSEFLSDFFDNSLYRSYLICFNGNAEILFWFQPK